MAVGKVLLGVSSVCWDTDKETSIWDKFWTQPFIKHDKLGKPNGPFPSCCEPHYESEANYEVFIMKIIFHSYEN